MYVVNTATWRESVSERLNKREQQRLCERERVRKKKIEGQTDSKMREGAGAW